MCRAMVVGCGVTHRTAPFSGCFCVGYAHCTFSSERREAERALQLLTCYLHTATNLLNEWPRLRTCIRSPHVPAAAAGRDQSHARRRRAGAWLGAAPGARVCRLPSRRRTLSHDEAVGTEVGLFKSRRACGAPKQNQGGEPKFPSVPRRRSYRRPAAPKLLPRNWVNQ